MRVGKYKRTYKRQLQYHLTKGGTVAEAGDKAMAKIVRSSLAAERDAIDAAGEPPQSRGRPLIFAQWEAEVTSRYTGAPAFVIFHAVAAERERRRREVEVLESLDSE